MPIVKKIHCPERAQYAFLDHSKTLVFSDVIKIDILFNTRALAPFVPIPRAPKKLYRATLKRKVKRWTYRDCYMTPFTIARKVASIVNAKPAEAMGGEYIPMILSLQYNELLVFKKTSEISSEIAAEFGFFPVSTKMKAQRACANIPWIKILYYFIS